MIRVNFHWGNLINIKVKLPPVKQIKLGKSKSDLQILA